VCLSQRVTDRLLLIQSAIKLIAGFDGLKAEVHAEKDRPSGRVRLCIGGAVAGIVAPPLLRALPQKYPEIQLAIAPLAIARTLPARQQPEGDRHAEEDFSSGLAAMPADFDLL
jgi:DNA-binding transcriptional LysR family regulator